MALKTGGCGRVLRAFLGAPAGSGFSRQTGDRYLTVPFCILWSPLMISVILALVPILFATGFLTWTMTMGAREQARSDAWAAQWLKANRPTH